MQGCCIYRDNFNNPVILAYRETEYSRVFIVKYYDKKLFEKRKGITLKNYHIYNYAISNKNKYLNFYIAKNPKASSLNVLKKNLEKYWPGWSDVHFKQEKKISNVIATGGLANVFSRDTSIFDKIDLRLTIKGLVYISSFNEDK